jgi:hypothetical protein
MQLTSNDLNELLLYDEESGKLYWRFRDVKWFNGSKPESVAKQWNSKYAGKEAFSKDRDGYRIGELFGKHQSAHIIIWTMKTGKWPDNIIDHQNGIRYDNRFENLKDVPILKNNQNKCISKNNTSGCTGVTLNKKSGKWIASIFNDSKRVNLGSFMHLSCAITFRKIAEKRFDYHPNHGREKVL